MSLVLNKIVQNSFNKMASGNYFGTIDCRNAKYQGSIRENEYDGVGFALSNNYMLSLTNWNNQAPYGPTFIVFPDRQYFYGHLKNRKMQGLACYIQSNKARLFFNFVNGVSQKIAFLQNQLIIEVVLRQGKPKILRTINLKNQETQIWKILSQILEENVSEPYRHYEAYVKNFLEKQFTDVVECTHSEKDTFIGIKNEISLGVKIDKFGSVRNVGLFSKFPRTVDFGRKYVYSGNDYSKTEEGRFTEPEEFAVYSTKRPTEAFKITEQFFKRGTSFKNSFAKFDIFDQMYQYFKDLQVKLSSETVLEYGQKILQKSAENIAEEQQYQLIAKEYTLEEVKQQIYDAAQRKGRHPLKQNNYSPETLRNSRSRDYLVKTETKSRLSPLPFNNLTKDPKKQKYSYNKLYEDDEDCDQKKATIIKHKTRSINQFTLNPAPFLQFQNKYPQRRQNKYENDHMQMKRNISSQKALSQTYYDGLKQLEEKQLLIFQLRKKHTLLRAQEIALTQPQEYFQINKDHLHAQIPFKKVNYTDRYDYDYKRSISRSKSPLEINKLEKNSDFLKKDEKIEGYENYYKYKNRNRNNSKESYEKSLLKDRINEEKSRQKVIEKTKENEEGSKRYEIYKKIFAVKEKAINQKRLEIKIDSPHDQASALKQEVVNSNPYNNPMRYKKSFKYL